MQFVGVPSYSTSSSLSFHFFQSGMENQFMNMARANMPIHHWKGNSCAPHKTPDLSLTEVIDPKSFV